MVLSGDGWCSVIADVFGWMVLDGCGWFWVLADSFGSIRVVFRDLNLKEVDNCEKFLWYLLTMTLMLP